MALHTTKRHEWEARFVSDYVLQHYPDDIAMHRVPIGPIPDSLQEDLGTPAAIRTFRPSRPVADAIVITQKVLIMIEGKIFNVRDGIGALLTYQPLLPHTPELQKYLQLPVVMQLVTARPPQWAIMAAEHSHVEIVVFQPDWIKEYYEKLQSYWTKESRAARITKKKTLESLGYD